MTSSEAERQAVLRRIGILDSPAEDSFDGLVDTAAALLEVPIALVSLTDNDRQWFKAGTGLAVRQTPRDLAFCAHAIHGHALFEVEDATLDARFADNPLVTDAPHIRFYAGQPLTVGGVVLGTLCVLDTRVRRLDGAQRGLLKQLAAVAAELLAGRLREADLRAGNERLADFVRTASDWYWELDAELRYTFISDGIRAATGQAPQQLIGGLVDDDALLDELGRPQPGGWRRLFERREAFARMVIERRIDGQLRHLTNGATPVWGADGELRGWRGTTRDVSVGGASDLWSRRQELLLGRITANVPGVIFQARRRADGLPQFLYLSPASEALFGFDAAAACAEPRLVTDRVHHADLPGVLAQFAAATDALEPWESEYRVVLPGAVTLWVETRALPEVAADGNVLWSGYTANITARKHAELKLRQAKRTWELAAEADGIGIATLDLARGRITLDHRAAANHGLAQPPGRYTIDDWLASIEPDDRASASAALRQAVEGRKHVLACVGVRWPDERVHSIEFAVAAMFDDDGRAVSLVSTCRDVTERLSIEQLQREKEAADRASRAKSEFLSRVSHELRTPLNSILGYTQLLALDTVHPLHASHRRQMESVQHSGRHLLGLIDDLLDLSRIENQDTALPLRGVDLHATLSVCLDAIAPLARRVEVTLPRAPTQPMCVHANARALEQVLTNLLSNAVKYNRRGGHVEIRTDADGTRVALSIRDEGPGLTPEQLGRLFLPFERLGAERGPVPGSGLGLVIARDLSRAMGGTLGVRSLPGAGATFTLTLDTGDPAAATLPGSLVDLDTAAAGGTPHQRRVLYIEDDPVNVLLMEEVIRRSPLWSMTVADTGTGGLDAALEAPPDLLLIDINLPDMTGLEVMTALRADTRTARLYCVALSADAMRHQIDTAMAAGFDDYWLKPIDVPRLLEQFGALTPPGAAAPAQPRYS